MKIKFLSLLLFVVSLSCQTSTKTSATKDDIQKIADTKKARPKDDTLIPRGLDFANAPEVIAFGSCANQNKPQPLWDVIFKSNPDLFIFSGDNIYASSSEDKPISVQYKKLNSLPEFRHFREKVPMLVTWDDHDYGGNDAGADNAEKEEARREFLYQWSYVKDSMRLNQNGVYHAKILGGVRKKSPTLQVIMLDTRWFRSPLKKIDDPANPLRKFGPTEDKKTTILGTEQWEWLERQLRKPADVRIVVSSIQLVAEEHGFEKWANFPHEKERFLNLLRKTQPKNLFIISGDRHRGTVAKQEVKGWGTLWDITSSGINKGTEIDETDKSYVGDQIKTENFGLVTIDWTHKKMQVQLRDAADKIVNKVDLKIR